MTAQTAEESMARVAVCTIVSKNYLAYARTLLDSVARHEPGWERFVLLVDTVDESVPREPDRYTLLPVEGLPLPDPRAFFFRYSILELNTAVKPWLLEALLDRGFERVVYLDPDIELHAPLVEVDRLFDEGARLVLTPHLTGGLPGSGRPNDRDILIAGAYNLGFLALAPDPDTRRLLEWWRDKNEYHCVVDVEAGLFVDQRWMDLAPGFVDGTRLLRDPGYNVAYWNLDQRPIETREGGVSVGGRPLAFFHWSGFDPRQPTRLSVHQDRISLAASPALQRLARDYAARVFANGHAALSQLEYGFGRLRGGTPIPDVARRAYRQDAGLRARGGDDPFALEPSAWNVPASAHASDPLLYTRLMEALWSGRPDLRRQFPDPAGADALRFASVFAKLLAPENRIPDVFVRPVEEALVQTGDGRVALRRSGVLRRVLDPVRAIARRLPAPVKQLIKQALKGVDPRRLPDGVARPTAPLSDAAPEERRWHDAPFAIKLVGYAGHTTGVGQSVRMARRALEAAGLRPIPVDCDALMSADGDDGFRAWPVPGDVNRIEILYVNADQTGHIVSRLEEREPGDREPVYRIGVWAWELDELPDGDAMYLDLFDEIWAPSRFIQDAIAAKARIPVLYIPYAVELEEGDAEHCARSSREALGLPTDPFLFLTMFDVASTVTRKNPQAVIEAFERAFPERDAARQTLVLKLHGDELEPGARRTLEAWTKDRPWLHVVDRTLSPADARALQASCDAFVSLHRSEGFGLNIAECMALGKAVIATAYSGNVDFMTTENSIPVPFETVPIEFDVGPYKAGARWAEPDIDAAAAAMKRLVEEPALARRLGERAARDIPAGFSPARVGALMRARLEQLARMTND